MKHTKVDPPGVERTERARAEELSSHLTPKSSTPTRRRCPSCRLVRPSGEFQPTAPPPNAAGLSWRTCPRCLHQGRLLTFARVDAGGKALVGR